MPLFDVIALGLVVLGGVAAGTMTNALAVRQQKYVITNPADLPEGADPELLNQLAPLGDVPPTPKLALLTPWVWPANRWWHPLTELVMSAALVTTWAANQGDLEAAVLTVAVGVFVCLAVIDIHVMRIIDAINQPATVLSALAIVTVSIYRSTPIDIAAMAMGSAIFTFIFFLAFLINPRGLGWGDVKLCAHLGLYLGWLNSQVDVEPSWVWGPLGAAIMAALVGSAIGALVAVGVAASKRSWRAVFPYGPSLVLGALCVMVWL